MDYNENIYTPKNPNCHESGWEANVGNEKVRIIDSYWSIATNDIDVQ